MPKDRALRLRKRAIYYNVVNAFRQIRQGIEPFSVVEDESDLNQSHVEYLQHQDSPGRNLDWDSFVEGSNHFQNIMAEVNLPDLSFGDLDTTRDTLNSEMTTEEALEDRLRRDPAGFRTLCKRTIKIMINAVPSPENIHNIRSHHMQQIVRKMEKGLSKLANYMNVLEFFLTDECEDISDEEARSLELLHSQLSKTQEELFASEKKLRDILKGLHAEEEKISSLSRMSLGAIAKTSSPQGQVGQGVQEQVTQDQPGLQISTASPTSSVLPATWQDSHSEWHQPPQASGLVLSDQQLCTISEQLELQYLSNPPTLTDSVLPKSSTLPQVVISGPQIGQNDLSLRAENIPDIPFDSCSVSLSESQYEKNGTDLDPNAANLSDWLPCASSTPDKQNDVGVQESETSDVCILIHDDALVADLLTESEEPPVDDVREQPRICREDGKEFTLNAEHWSELLTVREMLEKVSMEEIKEFVQNNPETAIGWLNAAPAWGDQLGPYCFRFGRARWYKEICSALKTARPDYEIKNNHQKK